MKTLQKASLGIGIGSMVAMMVFQTTAQDYQKNAPSGSQENFGKNKPEIAPPKPAAPNNSLLASDQPLMKGVVIVGSPTDVKPFGVAGAAGVKVDGPAFVKQHELQLDRIIKSYLGQPLTLGTLDRLQVDLVLFCRHHDHPVVDVFYPEQEVQDGTIQIIIYEGKVGKVSVVHSGHAWFKDSLITQQIHLKPGDSISAEQLLKDVNQLNRNPMFREVDVQFQQGQFKHDGSGVTDINLLAKERFPLRVFGGYDDYGLEVLGVDRLFAGFNYGNVFGLDQQFSYQYTTDLDFDKFRGHTASYVIPLPWGHTVSIYGGYNDFKPDLSKLGFNAVGQPGYSYQASLRYTVPLPGCNDFEHEVAIGWDHKVANSDAEFANVPYETLVTDIEQATIDYRAHLRDRIGYSQIMLSGFYSPGNLVGDDYTGNYLSSRAGAKSEYAYARVDGERGFNLPGGFLLLGKGGYQRSDANLLPSEQVGLGGYALLRGYPERIVSSDEGWNATAELHTPLMKLSNITGQKGYPNQVDGDTLDIFGFFDYGSVSPKHLEKADFDLSVINLASAGGGVEFKISHNLIVHATYGYQLRDIPAAAAIPLQLTKDKSRVDVSATLSF